MAAIGSPPAAAIGTRLRAAAALVGLMGLIGTVAGCGGTSARAAAAATTAAPVASPATTTTTTPPTTAPSATAAATSTTLGPRPPGTNTTYPSQAGPRLNPDGTPMASWLSEAATVDAQGQSDPTAQLVFLGDSITEGWLSVGEDVWDAVWVPRDPLDLGIVGDDTQNVLWRIAQGALAGLHPRAVVLLIGTNDFGEGWSAAQVAQGIVACAAAVRAALPNAAIELLTVFPRATPSDPAAIEVGATNAALGQAQLPVNTNLVDMTPTLSTAQGAPVPSLFSNDLLHPSTLGYEVIAGRLLAIPVLAQH